MTPASRPEYDVVVVGAGTAGSVLAARLSEEPSRHVLLVEAGDDYVRAEPPASVRAVNWRQALLEPGLQWPGLTARLTTAQKPVPYARGRGTGGSTLVNAMISMRGEPADFDDWAAAGATGWAWDDVLLTFRQLEDDPTFGDRPYRGRGGPMPVWRPGQARLGAVDAAFAQAAIAAGHPEIDDYDLPGSTGLSPTAFHCRDGVRVSAADAYLRPAVARPNLTVLSGAVAERLALSGSTVTGVHLRTTDGVASRISAAEVVLSAGAVNSPALLIRSGIGPAAALRDLDVPIVVDLPGVGEGLADHPVLWFHLPLHEDARAASLDAWPLGRYLRFSSADLGSTGDGSRNDLMALSLNYAGFGPEALTCGRLYLSLFQPLSRGRLRVTSLDPAAAPTVEVDMLEHPADLARMRVGVRHLARLAATAPVSGLADGPPTRGVLAGVVPQLITGAEPDDELDGLLRNGIASFNHAVGTCRMGPADDGSAVVDADCRVYGIAGLRVVDASVMPMIPRANTALTTVMLGEHVAGRMTARMGSSTSTRREVR